MAVLIVGTGAGCGRKAPVTQGEELPADESAGRSDLSADTENEEKSGEEADSDSSVFDTSLADTVVSDEAAAPRNEYVIYCPDETLPDIFESCYPGYEVVSEPREEEDGILTAEGLLGEVQIHWIITDYLTDTEKAGPLDDLLVSQQTEGASDYDWVDLFVIDELNIEKYIGDEVNVAMELDSLGISRRELKEQLPYTQQLGSDHRKQRASALDISPGVFLYRRSAAKAVLGADDPETVSKAVSDWDTFYETAEKAGESGYKMLAGYDAAFDVYAQSVKDDWYTDDGSLHIDDHLMKWVETTKRFSEKGICGADEIASDPWTDGILGKGDVFGYFLSAEEIGLIKKTVPEDNADSYGDWGIVSGPGNWYRGGTWLCAAVGTPNPGLSAEIIRNLTCNEQVMKDIYEKTGMTVNNRKVLCGNVSDVSDRAVALTESSVDSDISDRDTTLTESRVDPDVSGGSDMSADVPGDTSESESAAEAVERGIGFLFGDKEDIVGDAFCDPFFAGQQTGPVYLEAAKRVDNPVKDWERWILDDMFREAYYPYFTGECSANDSLAAFYQNAKGLIIMEDEEW